MADAGLFIGWGEPITGREAKGLEVFSESLAYYGRLEQEGVIEGFETALLEPHGGDIAGFILIRGSEDKLAQLRVDDEFVRMATRASLVVQSLGIVGAALGEGLEAAVTTYQQAISDLV